MGTGVGELNYFHKAKVSYAFSNGALCWFI